MSKFLEDIHREVQVRIDTYKRERDNLAKAAERVVELDALIAEAEAELSSFAARIPPKPEKGKENAN